MARVPATGGTTGGILGRQRSFEGTDALVRVLVRETSVVLQRAAATALGRRGDASGLTGLVAGLANPDPDVRAACAKALMALGREGRAVLEELAAGSGVAAGAAREALDAEAR